MAKGKRVVEVVERATEKVVHVVDVSDKSDAQINKVLDGMSINLDHAKFSLSVVFRPAR